MYEFADRVVLHREDCHMIGLVCAHVREFAKWLAAQPFLHSLSCHMMPNSVLRAT